MTLALYGKSRRRQTILVGALFGSMVFGMVMAIAASSLLSGGIPIAQAAAGPGVFHPNQSLPANPNDYDDPPATCDRGPYGVNDWVWHFVAPQANIVSLTATFSNGAVVQGVGKTGNPLPDNDKHAFVLAPAGTNLTSVVATVDPSGEQFQISHTCIGQRTVRIVKVTNTADHPGGSFAGTIMPGQVSPADTTWGATLAADAATAPGGSFVTSQTQQTLDEGTPPTDWAENGYAIVPDTGASPALCPDPVNNANYVGTTAIVPANASNYLVCVRNTYSGGVVNPSGTVNVSKTHSDLPSGAGDGQYAVGEDFTFTLTFQVVGGPLVGAVSFNDALPAGLDLLALGTEVDPTNDLACTGNTTTEVVTCTLDDATPIGTYSINLTVQPAATAQCGPVVNHVRTGNVAGQGTSVANDTVTVTNCVVTSTTVDKSDTGEGPYAPNDTFSYIISFTVSGSDTSQTQNFNDQLPPGIDFISLGTEVDAGNHLNCTGSQGSDFIICILNSPTPVGTYSQVVNVQVQAEATCGPAVNNVRTGLVPGQGTIVADETVTIQCSPADITFNKQDGVYDEANDEIDWTISITNSGGTAGSITIYDQNTTVDSETCDGAVVESPADNYTCNVPANTTVTLVLSTAVSQDYNPTCDNISVNNTASIAGNLQSSDTAQFSDTAEPNPACITVNKEQLQDADPAVVTWSISISNAHDFAQAVYVKDAGATFVSATNGTCDFLPTEDMSVGNVCVVNANSTMVITVTKPVPAATCEGTDIGNSVEVWFGRVEEGSPDYTDDGGTHQDVNADASLCDVVIQLCKVWQPNSFLNGSTTFLFDASDSSEETPATQTVSISGVTEGDANGECILLSVSPGLVTIDEQLPTGFLPETWTLGDGSTQDLDGPFLTPPAGFLATAQGCFPAIGGLPDILGLVRSVFALVVEVGSGDPECTITFFNTDDGTVSPTGDLRVEKFLDINGDGDANDVGEGFINGWDMTINGDDFNGTVATSVDGSVNIPGLTSGDVYNVSEEVQSGFTVTRVTVDGVPQGANSFAATSIPNGGTTVVRFFNQPARGTIIAHKSAVTSHNGGPNVDAPNDDDGWLITVSSANCGINVTVATGTNGNATFSNLPQCNDYVVSENTVNAASSGFVPVGPTSFSGQTPSGQTLTFVNRRATFDTPCVTCGQVLTTPIPPTPTATPVTPTVPATNTTVPATNTPTNTPTLTPVTGILGERTPGITPIAPSTGGGLMDGTAAGFNLMLIIGGFLALTSGLGLVAIARRNR